MESGTRSFATSPEAPGVAYSRWRSPLVDTNPNRRTGNRGRVQRMESSLVLEDGTAIRGAFFGARRKVFGELVFNTNMTGYTEALTDPSYRGQILMMTYPLIGNYGVDPESMESETIQPTGFVVKEACAVPRSEEHTSELQSRGHLVCRLLLEKKKRLCTTTTPFVI